MHVDSYAGAGQWDSAIAGLALIWAMGAIRYIPLPPLPKAIPTIESYPHYRKLYQLCKAIPTIQKLRPLPNAIPTIRRYLLVRGIVIDKQEGGIYI